MPEEHRRGRHCLDKPLRGGRRYLLLDSSRGEGVARDAIPRYATVGWKCGAGCHAALRDGGMQVWCGMPSRATTVGWKCSAGCHAALRRCDGNVVRDAIPRYDGGMEMWCGMPCRATTAGWKCGAGYYPALRRRDGSVARDTISHYDGGMEVWRGMPSRATGRAICEVMGCLEQGIGPGHDSQAIRRQDGWLAPGRQRG